MKQEKEDAKTFFSIQKSSVIQLWKDLQGPPHPEPWIPSIEEPSKAFEQGVLMMKSFALRPLTCHQHKEWDKEKEAESYDKNYIVKGTEGLNSRRAGRNRGQI